MATELTVDETTLDVTVTVSNERGPAGPAGVVEAVEVGDITPVSSGKLIGRHGGGSGAAQEVGLDGGLEFQGANIRREALTGDVTASAGSNATTIADDAVTNTKLANMAEGTIKGRASGAGTGDPQDLTAEQVQAIATTAASIDTALQSATSAQELSIRQSIHASELRGIDRLANYRNAIENAGSLARSNILLFGDSMIGTAVVSLEAAINSASRISGRGFLGGVLGGGATVETDACVKWINGETWRLDASGEYVEFAVTGSFAFEATSIKVYHLQQSGGGTYKIQLSVNGGAFADESGYTSISTAGSTAGVVNTINKTAYATTYKVRVVWVSGVVNIIGCGYRDSGRFGPIVSFITNGSTAINNIDNAALTARAITDPIFADIAPNLVILSHLDGATMVDSSQATLQNNMTAGIVSAGAPNPSWLVVGPPIGVDDTLDADRAAQQMAQMTLAASRGDAFFDNRTWAMPVSTVVSRGLITDSTHYTALAQRAWVTEMVNSMQLFRSPTQNAGAVASIQILGGGIFEATPRSTATYNGNETSHVGAIRLRGSNAILMLEDRTNSSNPNDIATVEYLDNVLTIGPVGGRVATINNAGQHDFYSTNGLSSRVGTWVTRWGQVFTGGLNTGIVTRTSSSTVAVTEMTIRANAASGAQTHTLPTPAAANNGHIFVIVKVDSSANAVTIGATVNGVANPTLTTQWQRMVVQSDGSTYTQIA